MDAGRVLLLGAAVVLQCVACGAAAPDADAESTAEAFLFSYFKGNGEDGLHLAWSADGLKWTPLKDDTSFLKPMVGNDKLMRDPCIIQGPDGLFHMVWTVSWKERGIGYAHSKDLINWSPQKYIPVMEHEPAARNCWAPEVFWDEDGEQYLIFWATTIPGRFPATETAGDGGLNHRMYYVTTRDFQTFSPTRLFYDPGFNVIDATIVRHNGRYIMFLKDETRNPPQKNIRIARSSRAEGPYGAVSEPITGDYWAEGPTAIRIKDAWVVYFDKYTKHRYGAVQSKDLTTWEDISAKVDFPAGFRHGTVFSVKADNLEGLRRLSAKP
ncbi:MAG: glycoside hydrolase family 43 protein [Phycisphaerae bacterium]|nr:glycoside hydrolase family 43 protein [Phycisphaerae bacterium]